MMKQKTDKDTKTPEPKNLNIRLGKDTLEQINDVVCALHARFPDVPWNKSSAMRYLLRKGIKKILEGKGGE